MPRLHLPAVLDISTETLQHELRDAIRSGSIELEASEVTRVDAAGLQLLVAAVRTARELGHAVHWCTPSPALCVGAQVLGLESALGLQLAEKR